MSLCLLWVYDFCLVVLITEMTIFVAAAVASKDSSSVVPHTVGIAT